MASSRTIGVPSATLPLASGATSPASVASPTSIGTAAAAAPHSYHAISAADDDDHLAAGTASSAPFLASSSFAAALHTQHASITAVLMFASLVISIAFVCTVILGGSWSVARADLSLPWIPRNARSSQGQQEQQQPHMGMSFGLTSYSTVGLSRHPKTIAYDDVLRSAQGKPGSSDSSPPKDAQIGPFRISIGDGGGGADDHSSMDHALLEPIRHLRTAGITVIVLLVLASAAQVVTLALVSCAALSKAWMRSYEQMRVTVFGAQTAALVALLCAQVAWFVVGVHASERLAALNDQSFGYMTFEHAFGWCFWLNLANAALVATSLAGFCVLLPHDVYDDLEGHDRAYATVIAMAMERQQGAQQHVYGQTAAAMMRGGSARVDRRAPC